MRRSRAEGRLAPVWARMVIGGAGALTVWRVFGSQPPAVFATLAVGAALCSLAADLDRPRPRFALALFSAVVLGGMEWAAEATAPNVGSLTIGFPLVIMMISAGPFLVGAMRGEPGLSGRARGGLTVTLAMYLVGGIPVALVREAAGVINPDLGDPATYFVVGAAATFALAYAQYEDDAIERGAHEHADRDAAPAGD